LRQYHVGTTACRAACHRLAGNQFDLAAGYACDPTRKLGDRDLLSRTDMIDAEMFAFFKHHHDA